MVLKIRFNNIISFKKVGMVRNKSEWEMAIKNDITSSCLPLFNGSFNEIFKTNLVLLISFLILLLNCNFTHA